MRADGITHLIFDLGEVLYRVHFSRAVRSFNALASAGNSSLIFSRDTQSELFHHFERGTITTAQFLDGLREQIGQHATDQELIASWNSILAGAIPNRKELLAHYANTYHISLLSNINALHYEHIRVESPWLFDMPDVSFLSFQVGMRKPDTEIYEEVVKRLDIKPENALFVDDSLPNIESAQQLGLHTMWLQTPESLTQSLHTILQ